MPRLLLSSAFLCSVLFCSLGFSCVFLSERMGNFAVRSVCCLTSFFFFSPVAGDGRGSLCDVWPVSRMGRSQRKADIRRFVTSAPSAGSVAGDLSVKQQSVRLFEKPLELLGWSIESSSGTETVSYPLCDEECLNCLASTALGLSLVQSMISLAIGSSTMCPGESRTGHSTSVAVASHQTPCGRRLGHIMSTDTYSPAHFCSVLAFRRTCDALRTPQHFYGSRSSSKSSDADLLYLSATAATSLISPHLDGTTASAQ